MVKHSKNSVESPITGRSGDSRHIFPAADHYKRERENFRRIKEELVLDPEYHEKFVAVHDNKIVGTSDERLELSIEMSRKFPNGSYFIGKIYSPPKGH